MRRGRKTRENAAFDRGAAFAQAGAEKISPPDTEEVLDTADVFYIYCSDNTFDQYAEAGDL